MTALELDQMRPVLLVEDDDDDVAIARRAFEKGRIGNPLYVVGDGEEALEYLRQTGRYSDPGAAPRPSLILLDLNMPRVDGREVLRIIKRDEDLRLIPVVVLTTSSDARDVLSCYRAGANTYVTKPLDFEEFLGAVMTIVRYWLHFAQLPDWSARFKG